MIVRVADLNADGLDDVLVLHRETRLVESYFGSGTDLLARGPTITLPAGVNGELGLYVENAGEEQTAIAATTAPEENKVFVLKLKPAPRAD
jgi:hypothetical protein